MKAVTASVLFTYTVPSTMHTLCQAHIRIPANVCELINEQHCDVMQKTDTSERGHQIMLTMKVLAFFLGGRVFNLSKLILEAKISHFNKKRLPVPLTGAALSYPLP